MGILGGVGKGLSRAATGGDHRMDLADYLKLAAMAASVGTGNVPGAIALGTSYAGDATGSKELKMAGDIGGMVAGGVGAANALSAGAGAAQGAAQAGQAAADAAGEGASLLQAGSQFTPEMIQGAEAAGNVFGTGADIAGQMAAVENFVGPIPPQIGQAPDPSVFKQALSSVLGDTADDRWQSVGDLSGTVADVAAQMGHDQPLPPELPEMLQTEDIMNYIPSHMALGDYMQSAQDINPYAAMFSKYPYGG